MDVESLVWIAIVLVIFAMAGSIIAKIFSKIILSIIVGIVIVATGIILYTLGMYNGYIYDHRLQYARMAQVV